MPHRRGRARVLSPAELQEHLAIPVYYILIGKAQAAFPHTATPAPSRFVQIIRVRQVDEEHISSFPAFVNWRQWNEIIAPMLEDCRWATWMGSTGGCHGETAIYQEPVGPGLYACNLSLRAKYVRLVGAELGRRARDVQT